MSTNQILYTAFFILILSALNSPAPASTLIVLPAGIELPAPNETFTVTIDIHDITDLGAFDVTLAYEPDIVTIQNESNASLSETLENHPRNFQTANLNVNNALGRLRFSVFSIGDTPGPSGNVPLVSVTFTVRDCLDSAVSLSNITLTDTSGAQLFGIAAENAVLKGLGLSDVIMTLQLLCGVPVSVTDLRVYDINNDNRVGIPEALNILQHIGDIW